MNSRSLIAPCSGVCWPTCMTSKVSMTLGSGKGLTVNHAGVWRYRVGDYRIIAQLIDNTQTVLALHVGHRRDVY